MAHNKRKLQVFVSSTFTDLHDERQAAVEAILAAGHIPAGMELFAAGNESQMQMIKRWIDESDVFMLILGGRYGSVEPKSGKSYIHLEYEYALKEKKPLFAIVITDTYLNEKAKKYGLDVLEQVHPDKLNKFRDLVHNKIVRFWDDTKDIKLAITNTLNEFNQYLSDFVGWFPGSEIVNFVAAVEKLEQLKIENTILVERLSQLESTHPKDPVAMPRFAGLTLNEMSDMLNETKLSQNEIFAFDKKNLQELIRVFGDRDSSILHVFWILSRRFQVSHGVIENSNTSRVLRKLTESGLIQEQKVSGTSYFSITDIGREYFLRLKIERKLEEAEKYILP
jgi:hypothetical protein